MIIINFKNYVHKEKALKLALMIEKYLPKAVVAVSAVDMYNIVKNTKLSVFAQHIDNVKNKQKSSGFVTLDGIKENRASGSLINHSEHQIGIEDINKLIADFIKFNLKSVVCATALKFVEELLKLKNKPYAIAFEDPELIATGKSITNYKSEDLKNFVKLLEGKEILPICGAGISSLENVVISREIGCKGVLIASAIANVKNPEKLLKDLQGVKF